MRKLVHSGFGAEERQKIIDAVDEYLLEETKLFISDKDRTKIESQKFSGVTNQLYSLYD